MLYVTLRHDTRDELRAFLVAEEEAGPSVKHFYLEVRQTDKSWRRSRKLSGDRFGRWMDRLGFDKIEAVYLLEEQLEKMQDAQS